MMPVLLRLLRWAVTAVIPYPHCQRDVFYKMGPSHCSSCLFIYSLNIRKLLWCPLVLLYVMCEFAAVRHSKEPGWLEGTLDGRTGLIPHNYVEYLNWRITQLIPCSHSSATWRLQTMQTYNRWLCELIVKLVAVVNCSTSSFFILVRYQHSVLATDMVFPLADHGRLCC